MIPIDLDTLPLLANLSLFCVAAAGVWLAGTRLSIYADQISDRMRIGKAFMGLVFLASATSLPELVTTITAAIGDNADLVLNNMFGGIALQTAILAMADAATGRMPLTFYPRSPTPILEACALALLLALLQSIIIVGEFHLVAGLGAGTLLLAAAYIATIYLFWTRDTASAWTPIQVPEEAPSKPAAEAGPAAFDHSLQGHWVRFAAATLAVLVFGVLLVHLTEAIADQSGLGSSFIGVTLLAGSTSLPELSTTIMAMRLRSYTMAISNIFGSNLIMLFLLLPADVFYRPGPILDQVDKSASFALMAGLIVTMVYVIGLVVRRPRRVLWMGLDSVVVLAVYAASLVALYHLR